MKKYYLFIPLALLLLFSSCSSLRIEKRHYNKGFYVDFGNDKKASAATDNSDKTDEVAVENTPQPVQENADRAIPGGVANTNTIQNPALPAVVSDQAASEPTEAKPESTEADQQKDATRVENNAPASSAHDSDVALVLLVILAIILPPLAVFLVEGATKWFWITLILCIFGGGVFFYPVIGGLWLIAMIIALLVVFGAI